MSRHGPTALPGLLLAAMLAISPFAVRAADLSQVGPQASAAQIIAARRALSQPVLRLVFAVSGGDRKAAEAMRVDLARDYVFVQTASHGVIYDYALRRIIGLDDARRSFANSSLYALVDFRVNETGNRRMLRRALDSLKLEKPVAMNDPFWVQSELHLIDPADPAPDIARQDLGEDGARFSYQASEVASYALSAETMTADEKSAFAHLLVERTSLHPDIAVALLAGGRLPQKLSFASMPMRNLAPEVWQLQSVSRVTASYPLTADYAAGPGAMQGAAAALGDIVPLMLEAVAGRAGSGPRPLAEYRAAIGDALQKKAGLQASLLAFEGMEQYGQDAFVCAGGDTPECHSLKGAFAAAQSDPRVGDLVQSLQIERTSPDQAVKLRENLRRDDVTNGYVLDDFIGNTMVDSGHADQALPFLLKAVRGDPYVAGYYKDLGNLFRQSFEPDPAWLCYDLGRVLPGGSSAPVIETITEYESRLVSKYPQFF